MKVIVLGSTGMLGHMVKKYLEVYHDIIIVDYRWPSREFKIFIKASEANALINCIGAIPQRKQDFNINYELPKWLDNNFNGIIIHPGTDCEMDNDHYGVSKFRAANWIKLHGVHTKIIKTSIIGPELSGNASLFSWFLSHNDGTIVNGYINHFWNGNTTLQWAKKANEILNSYNEIRRETIISTNCISKYELLSIINKVFERNIKIIPYEASENLMKCLQTNDSVSNIEMQLKELKQFYLV